MPHTAGRALSQIHKCDHLFRPLKPCNGLPLFSRTEPQLLSWLHGPVPPGLCWFPWRLCITPPFLPDPFSHWPPFGSLLPLTPHANLYFCCSLDLEWLLPSLLHPLPHSLLLPGEGNLLGLKVPDQMSFLGSFFRSPGPGLALLLYSLILYHKIPSSRCLLCAWNWAILFIWRKSIMMHVLRISLFYRRTWSSERVSTLSRMWESW